MLSKNLTRLVRSLEMKKHRQREGLFVAETPKVVGDLLQVFDAQQLIATEQWFADNGLVPRRQDAVVTDEELRRISFLQHPQQVVALFPLPQQPLQATGACADGLVLALDRVQDPGNVGTIIRIADWFGIDTVVCSPDTADAYSPKVVQATMGSLARVNIIYIDLPEWLRSLPASTAVYGTALDGDNLYAQELEARGVIVMGNEGNGLSPEVLQAVNKRLYIPSHRAGNHAESLNVAVATAVVCAEFRRRIL